MLLHEIPMFINSPTVDGQYSITFPETTFVISIALSKIGTAMTVETIPVFCTKPSPVNWGFMTNCASAGNGTRDKSPRNLVSLSRHIIPSFTSTIPQYCGEVKKDDGAKRMNSVELLIGYAKDNAEPSLEYTQGRCNDYWRGLAPLITSLSVRPVRDDIV